MKWWNVVFVACAGSNIHGMVLGGDRVDIFFGVIGLAYIAIMIVTVIHQKSTEAQ